MLLSVYFRASRFEGSLNVDLNEITMNLVPFPRLHYLVSSLSPLCTSLDLHLPPRKSVIEQLIKGDVQSGREEEGIRAISLYSTEFP